MFSLGVLGDFFSSFLSTILIDFLRKYTINEKTTYKKVNIIIALKTAPPPASFMFPEMTKIKQNAASRET